MDLDALKSEMKELSAPENFIVENKEMGNQTSGIIERLKKADQKSKEILRRFYIIYFIIAALYFGLFILNPDQELKFDDRLTGTLLFVGILLFAIMGRKKYTQLAKLRYDQSTHTFLSNALSRYKFWTGEMNYGLVIMLLINIVTCKSYVTNYPTFESLGLNILLFQAIFFSLMAIAFYFGRRHWKKHKKPILEELNDLLIEEK